MTKKLSTLCWPSFWWWGREGITICFAYKGSRRFLNDWIQPIGGVISQDASPKIVNAPLMVIFLMGQGGYCYLFCLGRQRQIPLWLTTTHRRCDFPWRMTNNRWRSIDAHFHGGAGRILQSFLRIKVIEKSFMTDYNLLKVWFRMTHDQK